MSNEIEYIATDEEVESGAEILDAAFDFTEIYPNKTILWGFVKVGNVLERNDRKLFKLILTLCNKLASEELGEEEKTALRTVMDYCNSKNIDGLNTYLSTLLVEKLNLTTAAQKIFYNGLSFMASIIEAFLEKCEELKTLAESGESEAGLTSEETEEAEAEIVNDDSEENEEGTESDSSAATE